jgi:ABC-type transport system involved in multi-copper enzyme maturation permease subunit
MTTDALSTVPRGAQARPRRIPWRRMAWIIWRQHRFAIAGVLAVLAVAAAFVVAEGLQLHHAYTAVTACRPAGSGPCQLAARNFANSYSQGSGIVAALLQVVPALIGAFAGAPLLAREFESGTFRFVFTQGIGRVRYSAAKLVSLAVVVTVLPEAFSAVYSWAYGPLIGQNGYGYSALAPTFFDLQGVALAAWTLAAFAIGVFAGVLIRRVLPAMFATLAAWFGLAVATALFFRVHYRAALLTTNPNIASPARVVSRWWTLRGKPVGLSALSTALRPVDIRVVTQGIFSPGPDTPHNLGDPVNYLLTHGFTLVSSYQPGSWFWPFQLIEGAWLLLLSVLLCAAAIWLFRRRAT